MGVFNRLFKKNMKFACLPVHAGAGEVLQEAMKKVSEDGMVFIPLFKDLDTAQRFANQLPFLIPGSDSLRRGTHCYIVTRLVEDGKEIDAVVTGGAITGQEKQIILDLQRRHGSLNGSMILA